MTQFDPLVFTTREQKDVVVIMEMLNGTGFIAQLGTPDKHQFHLVLLEIDTNVQDWLAENAPVNCTLFATVTGTSVATIQQSASTQKPSCESLEQVLYGCPVVFATIPAIKRLC